MSHQKKGPLISIVVPVYNCKDYLREMMNSVIAQSYRPLELILVDDGSTDESLEICLEYEKEQSEQTGANGDQDLTIRVFARENQGVSATRNFGIRQAKGEYLMFLDSDDTVEPDLVSVLYRTLVENHGDVSLCGLTMDYENHQTIYPEKATRFNTNGVGAVREILNTRNVIAGPVCKLFQRDLLEEDPFPEDLTYGEDAVAMVKALKKANVAAFNTRPLYHYRRRKESATGGDFEPKQLDLITAYDRIEKEVEGMGLESLVQFRKIWAHFRIYDQMILSGSKDIPEETEIRDWLIRHKEEIYQNPRVGKNRKIALRGLCRSKAIYKAIILIRSRKRRLS